MLDSTGSVNFWVGIIIGIIIAPIVQMRKSSHKEFHTSSKAAQPSHPGQWDSWIHTQTSDSLMPAATRSVTAQFCLLMWKESKRLKGKERAGHGARDPMRRPLAESREEGGMQKRRQEG